MSPYAYPPRPPNTAYPGGVYPTGTDTKAILSLILGIISIVMCCGIITGIPAIILGALARRDIAKSQGALGGEGMAIGGIVTGGIAVVGSLLYLLFYVGIFGAAIAAGPGTPPPPPYIPPPTYTPYGTSTATTTAPTSTGLPLVSPVMGTITVHDAHRFGGNSLHSLIALELGEAKDDGARLLVVAVSPTCAACDELFGELFSPELQKALSNVNILRVDVTEWKAELAGLGMDNKGVPWFYRFDDSIKIIDAISADEWGDNTAENIAPVLEKFMKGTYKKKLGTTTPDAGALPSLKKDAGHEVF